MKPWILVFALAALGVALYLFVALTGTAATTTVPAVAATNLTTKAGRPTPSMTARPEPSRFEDPVESEPPQANAAKDSARAAAPPTEQEVRDHLQAAFVAEPSVAPGQVAPDLDQRLHAVLPTGSTIRSVECRGSLCRVETTHPSLDGFRDFVQRAYLTPEPARVSNGPVLASVLAEPVAGQPVIAVAYLGKEGSALPMPAPHVPDVIH